MQSFSHQIQLFSKAQSLNAILKAKAKDFTVVIQIKNNLSFKKMLTKIEILSKPQSAKNRRNNQTR